MPRKLGRYERMVEWLRLNLGQEVLSTASEQDELAMQAFAHLAVAWNRGASEHCAVAGMAACIAVMQRELRHLPIIGLACFADWPAIGKLRQRLVPERDLETTRRLLRTLDSISRLGVAGCWVEDVEQDPRLRYQHLPSGPDWLSGACSKGAVPQ